MGGKIAKNVQLSDGRDSYLAVDDQVGVKVQDYLKGRGNDIDFNCIPGRDVN